MNAAKGKDIEVEAAAWLARLQRDAVSDADRAAFLAWRSKSGRHDAAFVRLDAISRRMDRLAALRPVGGSPNPDLLVSKPASRRLARVGAWAMAAMLAAVFLGIAWWQFYAPHHYERSLTTERGGFQRALLPDGSVIHLNTASAARIQYSAGQRRVYMRVGEATFVVAKDTARPFIVDAGGITVRAVGTAFTVRLQSGKTNVLVTEGQVEIAAQPPMLLAESRESVPLSVVAGQTLIADRESVETRPVSNDESARQLAWHSGMLSFDNEALADIVAEFNRYSLVQMRIDDPTLAGYRMGGYFRATSIDAFLAVLEQQFDVRTDRSVDGTIRLERTERN